MFIDMSQDALTIIKQARDAYYRSPKGKFHTILWSDVEELIGESAFFELGAAGSINEKFGKSYADAMHIAGRGTEIVYSYFVCKDYNSQEYDRILLTEDEYIEFVKFLEENQPNYVTANS